MIYDNFNEEREVLNSLMKDADLFVKYSTQKFGSVEPALFIHGEGGVSMFLPGEMVSVEDKEGFARIARLVCKANAADASVFISEAWFKCAKPGEILDLSKAPSEYKDREEVVIMMGETQNQSSERIIPIERTVEGKFIGLGMERNLETDKIEGRFANFISAEPDNAEVRAQAMRDLEKTGLDLDRAQKEEERKQGVEIGTTKASQAQNEESAYYYVLSPDGIPVTPEPFGSKEDAKTFIPKWCEGFKEQGYYAAAGERIHLDDLADRLDIVSESEYYEAIEKAAKDRQKDRGRGYSR